MRHIPELSALELIEGKYFDAVDVTLAMLALENRTNAAIMHDFIKGVIRENYQLKRELEKARTESGVQAMLGLSATGKKKGSTK